MMKNEELKKANKKALPIFIVFMVICYFLGFGTGRLLRIFRANTWKDCIENACAYFGTHIAPYIAISIIILIPLLCIPICLKIRKLLLLVNEEMNDIDRKIETNINIITYISYSLTLTYCFLLSAMAGGVVFWLDKKTLIFGCMIACLEFVALQYHCMNIMNALNPEKKTSVFDIRFQSKFIASCDEAEKLKIGKCSYKAFSVTNLVCYILLGITFLSALVYDTGFLPSLLVFIIGFINYTTYAIAEFKYSKSGAKIR